VKSLSLNGVFQALTVSADLELIKSTQHPSSFAVNYKKGGQQGCWTLVTVTECIMKLGKICMSAEMLYIHRVSKILLFLSNKKNHLLGKFVY